MLKGLLDWTKCKKYTVSQSKETIDSIYENKRKHIGMYTPDVFPFQDLIIFDTYLTSMLWIRSAALLFSALSWRPNELPIHNSGYVPF